jgi:hypothetical protein
MKGKTARPGYSYGATTHAFVVRITLLARLDVFFPLTPSPPLTWLILICLPL